MTSMWETLQHLPHYLSATSELLFLGLGIVLGAAIFARARRQPSRLASDPERVLCNYSATDNKHTLTTTTPEPEEPAPSSPTASPTRLTPQTPRSLTDLPPPLRTTLVNPIGRPWTSADLAKRPWKRYTYPLARHADGSEGAQLLVTDAVQFFSPAADADAGATGAAAGSILEAEVCKPKPKAWRKRRTLTFEAVAAPAGGAGAEAGADVCGRKKSGDCEVEGEVPGPVQGDALFFHEPTIVSEADMWARMRAVEIDI